MSCIVGIGACSLDHLAFVSTFPRPDTKVRTDPLLTQGGGNCANALTAASRLGASTRLVSKVGSDSAGTGIVNELRRDGVDTSCVAVALSAASPSTYVIVDRSDNTRTCLHSPGPELTVGDVYRQGLDAILRDAAVLFCDGRMGAAAVEVAQRARARGIPVIVEAERPREHLDELLQLADFVVASRSFAQSWTMEDEFDAALLATFSALPRAKCLVATLGERGSVLLFDRGRWTTDVPGLLRNIFQAEKLFDLRPAAGSSAAVLGSIDAALSVALGAAPPPTAPSCRSRVAAHPSSSGDDPRTVTIRPRGAVLGELSPGGPSPPVHFIASAAADVDQTLIRDTTGAGDAFIGALLAGLSCGLSLSACLAQATLAGAACCLSPGARAGLPRLAEHLGSGDDSVLSWR